MYPFQSFQSDLAHLLFELLMAALIGFFSLALDPTVFEEESL